MKCMAANGFARTRWQSGPCNTHTQVSGSVYFAVSHSLTLECVNSHLQQPQTLSAALFVQKNHVQDVFIHRRVIRFRGYGSERQLRVDTMLMCLKTFHAILRRASLDRFLFSFRAHTADRLQSKCMKVDVCFRPRLDYFPFSYFLRSCLGFLDYAFCLLRLCVCALCARCCCTSEAFCPPFVCSSKCVCAVLKNGYRSIVHLYMVYQLNAILYTN